MEEGKKKERRRKEEVNEVAQVYHEPHVIRTFPKIENFPKTPEFLNNTRGTVI